MTNAKLTKSSLMEFPEPRMIPINGLELEVFESGTQNYGRPVVLCHGFPEHAFSWRFQIPALVEAGYHVLVPNQRGYGNSSRPLDVSSYDIKNLTDDLIALLDFYGYQDATFIGHDWGANVVWNLALLHPNRVKQVINFALPYQNRGERPWIEMLEEFFGEDFYFVHFNKKPGVADAILEENTSNFLRNLFRKNLPPLAPESGMHLINLAKANYPLGDPILSEKELSVFVAAFETSGFTGGINWYRNLDRNWHLMADTTPLIHHPTLMIYGERDSIPKSNTLKEFAPNLEVISLDCGHWIPQEKPEEANRIMKEWLKRQDD